MCVHAHVQCTRTCANAHVQMHMHVCSMFVVQTQTWPIDGAPATSFIWTLAVRLFTAPVIPPDIVIVSPKLESARDRHLDSTLDLVTTVFVSWTNGSSSGLAHSKEFQFPSGLAHSKDVSFHHQTAPRTFLTLLTLLPQLDNFLDLSGTIVLGRPTHTHTLFGVQMPLSCKQCKHPASLHPDMSLPQV